MVASQPGAIITITPPCLEVLEENATMEKSFAIERSLVSISANGTMGQSAHIRQGTSSSTISEYTVVLMELLLVESLIACFGALKAAPGLRNFFFVRDRKIWSPSLSDDARKKNPKNRLFF